MCFQHSSSTPFDSWAFEQRFSIDGIYGDQNIFLDFNPKDPRLRTHVVVCDGSVSIFKFDFWNVSLELCCFANSIVDPSSACQLKRLS